MLLQSLFFDVRSADHGIVKKVLEWEPGEKPLNPMKKTKKENRETTKNILAL